MYLHIVANFAEGCPTTSALLNTKEARKAGRVRKRGLTSVAVGSCYFEGEDDVEADAGCASRREGDYCPCFFSPLPTCLLFCLSLLALKAVCLEERTRSPASFLRLSLFLRSLSSCLSRSFFYFASFCFCLPFFSNSVSRKGGGERFSCSFVFPDFLFASALSFVSPVCRLDSLSVSLVCAPFLPRGYLRSLAFLP